MFFTALLLGFISISCLAQNYPLDIPSGGRFDVHGWLILPWEQAKPSDPATPIKAWFSHHVPEFWTDSPHNFQIILQGTLEPMSCVANDLYSLEIPYPPVDNELVFEYSFTPPSPFSLNDLLSGQTKELRGIYYNGSFDTPYQRISQSLARMTIQKLTTAVYLNETEANGFKYLQYLSYPRGGLSSAHLYLAHQIRQQPDFDHVVHGTITQCSSESSSVTAAIHAPGAAWEFPNVPNTLDHKLEAGQELLMRLVSPRGTTAAAAGSAQAQAQVDDITCTLRVLESIHCMIGPDFMSNC